jgi:drug/metabolite transporter (DMT)-like permease
MHAALLRLPALATARLSAPLRGMLWTMASGLIFTFLNTTLRVLATDIPAFETQFLRYFCGLLVMMPFILRAGPAAFQPNGLGGQLWRGVVHTSGLMLWFIALPHITLADMTALGFTSPIFVMLGAALVFKERLRADRMLAAGIGFVGVLIVLGPNLTGAGGIYNLAMLASAPLFAASFLITKALTKRDRPEVIVVWQAITVAFFSFPFALLDWTWPSAGQLTAFLACGVLGSTGHYCVNRGLRATDISATQSVKFLDLIWTTASGFIVFADVPAHTTFLGALVILAATTWIARREARRR